MSMIWIYSAILYRGSRNPDPMTCTPHQWRNRRVAPVWSVKSLRSHTHLSRLTPSVSVKSKLEFTKTTNYFVVSPARVSFWPHGDSLPRLTFFTIDETSFPSNPYTKNFPIIPLSSSFLFTFPTTPPHAPNTHLPILSVPSTSCNSFMTLSLFFASQFSSHKLRYDLSLLLYWCFRILSRRKYFL